MVNFAEYLKEAKEEKEKNILLGDKKPDDLKEADKQKDSENADLKAKDASHGDKPDTLKEGEKEDGECDDKKDKEKEDGDESLNESKKDEEYFETFMLMAMESVVKKSGKSRDEIVELFKKDIKFRKFIVSEAKKLIKAFEDEIETIK